MREDCEDDETPWGTEGTKTMEKGRAASKWGAKETPKRSGGTGMGPLPPISAPEGSGVERGRGGEECRWVHGEVDGRTSSIRM